LLPRTLVLGIAAVYTGFLGKYKDEEPRMARVGFAMGLPAMVLSGFLLYMLIVTY